MERKGGFGGCPHVLRGQTSGKAEASVRSLRLLQPMFLPRPKPTEAKRTNGTRTAFKHKPETKQPSITITHYYCFVVACSESGAFGMSFFATGAIIAFTPAKTMTKAERKRKATSKQAEGL
ncbi:MAG: hypothetical protein NTV87_12700 [Ignavibacteriae bacterium]|nr:hypothetical protein [Ignavibacteriota bacterium]